MTDNVNKQHGGARAGAGRKKGSIRKAPTVLKRIPEMLVPAVEQWIAANQDLLTINPKNERPDGAMAIVSEASSEKYINLALSKVAAGLPSYAEDTIDTVLDLNDYLVASPTKTFAIRASGISMVDAGIDPDDLLLVDTSLQPKHNDIVVANVDNNFTVKRLHVEKLSMSLHAENHLAEYPVLTPRNADVWNIIGVVTSVIKTLR